MLRNTRWPIVGAILVGFFFSTVAHIVAEQISLSTMVATAHQPVDGEIAVAINVVGNNFDLTETARLPVYNDGTVAEADECKFFIFFRQWGSDFAKGEIKVWVKDDNTTMSRTKIAHAEGGGGWANRTSTSVAIAKRGGWGLGT